MSDRCKLPQSAGPGWWQQKVIVSPSFVRQEQNTEHKMADNVAQDLDKMKISEGKEVRYFC